MQTIVEDRRLPAEVDAQPVVQAAAALKPAVRHYHDEIEREQRLSPALVEQMHAAGFYRLLLPRSLGGLQADPLTYIRVIELLAEAAGSVGWNVANNGVGSLVTLGLPDDGVQEIYPKGHRTVIAGTAVQGGGQAVAVEGGYRVSGRWTFGSGCHEAAWMLGSFQILDDGQPRRDDGGMFWRGLFPRAEVEVIPGTWEVSGLRGTGSFDWTVSDFFLPKRRTMVHAGVPLDNQWGHWPGLTYALPAQAWVGPHQCAVITGLVISAPPGACAAAVTWPVTSSTVSSGSRAAAAIASGSVRTAWASPVRSRMIRKVMDFSWRLRCSQPAMVACCPAIPARSAVIVREIISTPADAAIPWECGREGCSRCHRTFAADAAR